MRGRHCWNEEAARSGEFKYGTRPVVSEEDLFEVLQELTQSGLKIEIALRRIGKGLCIKSFPVTHQSFRLIELVELCQGGYSGADLVMLPYPSLSVLENPNLFFEARDIYNQARNRFLKEQEPKTPKGK